MDSKLLMVMFDHTNPHVEWSKIEAVCGRLREYFKGITERCLMVLGELPPSLSDLLQVAGRTVFLVCPSGTSLVVTKKDEERFFAKISGEVGKPIPAGREVYVVFLDHPFRHLTYTKHAFYRILPDGGREPNSYRI